MTHRLWSDPDDGMQLPRVPYHTLPRRIASPEETARLLSWCADHDDRLDAETAAVEEVRGYRPKSSDSRTSTLEDSLAACEDDSRMMRRAGIVVPLVTLLLAGAVIAEQVSRVLPVDALRVLAACALFGCLTLTAVIVATWTETAKANHK